MGATPTKDGKGLELRVWAPNAKAVATSGEIGEHALASEGSGMWAATIGGGPYAGKKYRWVITTNDGRTIERLDPRGRMVADGASSVVVDPRTYAWQTKAFTAPARENAIVYEMHVGTFGEGGTFKGATAKLDALADLGINVIELMPVSSFGGRNGWGYNPHSYYAPHAAYGTPDDLRAFVDAAHARGIAVIADVVYNHYDGWSEAPLRCFDGQCPDDGAGVYFFSDATYAKTPWGPRLAFSTKEVSDFVVDNVFSWMSEYRIDGFRHDSVSNVRAIDGKGSVPGGVELLKKSNEVADGVSPSAFLVAEDLKGFTALTSPRAKGGYGFDTQWDGFFQWAITSAVVAKEDSARDIAKVSEAIQSAYDGDPFARLVYVESHDTAGNEGARLPVRIDAAAPASLAARKRAMLAAGVLLTAPGVPMLFMGQEMLESTKFSSPPSPLDWTHATDNAGTLAFYKDAIKARRELTALSGKNIAVTHLNSSTTDRVIVYRRWNQAGDDVMVVANFGGKRYTRYDVGLPASGAWKARVDGDDVRYGSDFGAAQPTAVSVTDAARDNLPFTGSITLAPYSIVILTR
jgi:1,4-alpha-glucan branching enzyme